MHFNLSKDKRPPSLKEDAAYETAPAQHGRYTFTELPTTRSEQSISFVRRFEFWNWQVVKFLPLPQDWNVPAKKQRRSQSRHQ